MGARPGQDDDREGLTMSNKTEALGLLALDTMTRKQRDWLDILTAHQAGLQEIVMQEGRYDSELDAVSEAHQPGIITRLMDHDELWGYLNVPNYTTSVDACLTLPLPEGYFWLLESKFGSDPYGAILYKAFMKQETQKKYQSDASLPLAMLRAWWTMQPD